MQDKIWRSWSRARARNARQQPHRKSPQLVLWHPAHAAAQCQRNTRQLLVFTPHLSRARAWRSLRWGMGTTTRVPVVILWRSRSLWFTPHLSRWGMGMTTRVTVVILWRSRSLWLAAHAECSSRLSVCVRNNVGAGCFVLKLGCFDWGGWGSP